MNLCKDPGLGVATSKAYAYVTLRGLHFVSARELLRDAEVKARAGVAPSEGHGHAAFEAIAEARGQSDRDIHYTLHI